MSDEQSPPPLRLRPRKRDDEAAPTVTPKASAPVPAPVLPVLPPRPVTPPAVEPTVTNAPAVDASPLRFRLKPKLSGESEPAPVQVPTTQEPAPAPVANGPAAPEIPRLKLKPLVAQESAGVAPVLVTPPIATGSAPFPELPAFPVVHALAPMPVTESSVPEPLIGGLPPVMVDTGALPMPPPRAMPPPPPVVAPSPYKSKTKPKRPPVTLILIAVVVVLLLAGGSAYFFFLKPESSPTVQPVANSTPVVPVVAIPKAPVVQIAPLPPPPAPLQPVVSAPLSTTPVAPVATPVFRAWVSDVRISGVRSGASTMAIVNGRLARPGDMVDAAEGIVFESVDGEQKLLSFRGRNGAILTKPY